MDRKFDMSLVQRGARLRRSPFFESTLDHGAQSYTVYNHMLFPINFADLEEEYWQLINGVTLWDVSVERQVEISGPDAFAFTNMLTPRDLSSCAVGQGKYVLITAEDGGIINDPVLLRLAEDRFWLALADSDVLLWVKGVALNSGMDVDIFEPDVSPLQIQGPKSMDVMEALVGPEVLDLDYYYFIEVNLGDIPLIVTRTGWSGEVGYEIYLRDSQFGAELWERIFAAGKDHGLAPTGPSDIRRIEAGILNYGADMTIMNNPYEVGLGWLVDLDGDQEFIGREALARIKAAGVDRKLVGLEISGDPIPFNMTRWPVFSNGEEVGYVTSAVYSPRLKLNIGYANVPVELADIGQELVVSIAGVGDREARVVRKPFVDPDKSIPKSALD